MANASYHADATDRQFYIFGFSYNRLLVHGHFCDVRWVSEIMPAVVLREPFLKGTSIPVLSTNPPLLQPRSLMAWEAIRLARK